MPKRVDIKSILIIGAGPIVIGQGCEFDYSGVQACKALKSEGYRIILVNSNPATIMTDPDLCDATYIEPLTIEFIEKIIIKEKPDALLPTMGGQTALNCALSLNKAGILKKYNVELIGANCETISKAEDREKFRKSMQKIGLEVPKSKIARSLKNALNIQKEIGFPTVIRPSFTLGGSGSGIAYTEDEFLEICNRGFLLSSSHELLIEESLLGWKEFELEVIRDKADNCIIVCTIENLDPMGIHTGDSITVSPAQTLTDKEYQIMRNSAILILREIGVETGGANVQFAVDPKTGRLIVIEMNPRVSRSSALASKAMGFPIAKIAAKLAVGYTLDELKNDITQNSIPASFEPTIDYVVTKIPRFNFDKFPFANDRLMTQMKSVGEVMAIGRTFQESLQKALSSLENGFDGLMHLTTTNLNEEISIPGPNRIFYIANAFRQGYSIEKIHKLSLIDHWFLKQIEELIQLEKQISEYTISTITKTNLLKFKRKGFSDRFISNFMKVSEDEIRTIRHQFSLHPVYKKVDSCSAEFPTKTNYFYSTYEEYCEANPTTAKKIIILGSGPNRIGQGIEFDYCCVHAALALREKNYETIMINCNPETVSTDYDVSDRLYFEPLTLEHVLEIVRIEKPLGVIIQYGGQTPLKLAKALHEAGVTILGTSADSIDCAEDRQRFSRLVETLNLKQPKHGFAFTIEEGLDIGMKIGFPLILRPSYVLGGHAMEIIYNMESLGFYLKNNIKISDDSPVLIDQFLENATEIDVDAVSDGAEIYIGGLLEHLEFAGVHSGDSTCSLPPFSLSTSIQEEVSQQMIVLTKALSVIGPINVQFAIKNNEIYVLEVNPRVSRTVPFVSKAIGIPLAKVGAFCMINCTLKEQGIQKITKSPFISVKLPVFSFNKFPGIDPILGPVMKSTGEVMGIADTFDEAYIKCMLNIWPEIKRNGQVYLSVTNELISDIQEIIEILLFLNYKIITCSETNNRLYSNNLHLETLLVTDINYQELDLIIIIGGNQKILKNSEKLRIYSNKHQINYIFTMPAAKAILRQAKYQKDSSVYCLNQF